MKQKLSPLLTGVLILLCTSVIAQKNDVQTVFKKGARSSGGYGCTYQSIQHNPRQVCKHGRLV